MILTGFERVKFPLISALTNQGSIARAFTPYQTHNVSDDVDEHLPLHNVQCAHG